PGGMVTVYGNVIVNNAHRLNVGTSAAGPPYADLIIKGDLKQMNGGDAFLDRNARVMVFGNLSDNGDGGTRLTLNQGAQMYVNGNINYSGGGAKIANNNAVNPYGLYVNGTINNTGGGSTTTTNTGDRSTMVLTDPIFSTWVGMQQAVMPVTLVSFEVTRVSEEGIELKWETASEENFDYFVIEGSTDGRAFYELTQTRDYSYLVTNPTVGKSYYRLKSVDLDGRTETFKMVSATYESSKEVKVFPNPVVDSKMNVDFNFDPSEAVTVTITNLNGMEVSRQVLNSMQNLVTLSIEPGTYIIRIQSTEISSVSRVVVK
ncbi:MAG TPA: T9SS type A sorting domain-containing protein, partial [Cyclobacteriaceae bacterium]